MQLGGVLDGANPVPTLRLYAALKDLLGKVAFR